MTEEERIIESAKRGQLAPETLTEDEIRLIAPSGGYSREWDMIWRYVKGKRRTKPTLMGSSAFGLSCLPEGAKEGDLIECSLSSLKPKERK